MCLSVACLRVVGYATIGESRNPGGLACLAASRDRSGVFACRLPPVTGSIKLAVDPRALRRCISASRLAGYESHCGGDWRVTLELYAWNTEMTGAMWETMGHLEVALRNALSFRLARRHRRLHRVGDWLDDPACELDTEARTDIAQARRRVQRNRKPLTQDQVISELGFGFWRFLLAKRYATTLWPDLAGGFPNSPDRNRATVDGPVRRIHLLRNRLAHHQRIWTESLPERWAGHGCCARLHRQRLREVGRRVEQSTGATRCVSGFPAVSPHSTRNCCTLPSGSIPAAVAWMGSPAGSQAS